MTSRETFLNIRPSKTRTKGEGARTLRIARKNKKEEKVLPLGFAKGILHFRPARRRGGGEKNIKRKAPESSRR